MKNKELRNRQPMQLQFFAEDANDSADSSVTPETEEKNETGTEAVVDTDKEEVNYQAKLAEMEAKNKKLKADLDNALKKTGDLTKQLRAKMTETELREEKAAQEAEEQKAYVTDLENYKKENEAFKRYTIQGMDSELAAKAAKAEIEGDMDALADIQKQHTQALLKAKEAEWKASRPRVNMGNGEDSSMTKEEILAIKDINERQKAIASHLDLFNNKD